MTNDNKVNLDEATKDMSPAGAFLFRTMVEAGRGVVEEDDDR